jgi:iron complex outermembrane recepter protein
VPSFERASYRARMRAQLPIILLLIVLTAASASAQPRPDRATITGAITNSLSGDVVPNLIVTLESPAFTQSVKTGPDGRYTLTNVPAGAYHLNVRGDGFLPLRVDVTVSGAPQTSDLRIDPELHYSEVTSVSPDSRNQFDAYQATNVLGGQELTKELQSTLGATLQNEPGVATRSFGPGPARPVIRGLDGDRVLILEDGMRMGDLSSQSGDHGVNVNPAASSRLEVVRGPATLLYGANAIGGLVNVVTNEIPTAPVLKASGSLTVDAATAAAEGGAAGDVTVGRGHFAAHVSASGHRTGDYDTPEGTIPNSFSRAGFAEVGAGYVAENAYFGGSFAYDKTHYGIPFVEAGETNLDPRRSIFNVRGERRGMNGFLDSIRGSFGLRRYRHDELDGEEIATSFRNDTSEVELLASHKRVSRMKGSIGASFLTRSFESTGEESLSPPVDQKGGAFYVYEEIALSRHADFQFGGRYDHQAFTPAVDEPDRTFDNVSGSIGLLVHPTDATGIAFSLARAARNPALEELYFHGPHAGNNAVENGDPNLQSEHAVGFDAAFRWRSSRTSGDVTFFANRIDNFIFRQFTGEVDELPVTFFTQADATLTGIESHVDVRLTSLWAAEGGIDYVRGQLTDLDQPLPRMPPLRGRAGLRFQKNAFQAGADAVFTAKQDRIFELNGIGETPTDGYNLLKLFAAYSIAAGRAVHTFTARLDNATDELYHNHLNYLKDLAPELGRDFRIVYSVRF